MKRASIHALAVSALLVGVAPMAFAGEAGGHNLVVTKPSMTTELPNGMSYTSIGTHQVCMTTDPGSPLNRASGDCDGACVAAADGNATCMGSCTWLDSEGDVAFFTWNGATEGSWSLKGGTGKYAEASGEGTWKTDGFYAGEITGNTWQGTIEIP